MVWLNEPPAWAEQDGALHVTTAPDTDFWRTTHDGFVRDTGHFRHAEPDRLPERLRLRRRAAASALGR